MTERVRFLLIGLAVCALGCEVGTRARDGGPVVDSGDQPHDAGDRDAGPGPDAGDRLDDVLIYAHSSDTLYEFSAYTNTVREIGPFVLQGGAPAPQMNDLAVSGDGLVVTVGDEEIFVVDAMTVVATPALRYRDSSDPFEDRLFALSYLPPDQSPSGREMLVGATNGGEYYQIDLITDRFTLLGQYPGGWGSSGDIVSVAGLGTFATLRMRDAQGRPVGPDSVAEIQFDSMGRSTVRIIGTPRDATTEYEALFGLGYWGRNLYGFTSQGELLQIDRGTAQSVLVTNSSGADQFWGAGVTTRVPFLF